MTHLLHRLAQPWARAESAYSLPGTLVIKLCLGEAPEHLPSLLDVRRNVSEPARFLNVAGGPYPEALYRRLLGLEASLVHENVGKNGP